MTRGEGGLMAEKSKPKTCFVICPIGKSGSDERRRSDDVFHHLIRPVVSADPYLYQADRAIDDARPGEITAEIVRRVIESDLVIADLSDRNPNVFYELALRHQTGKPFIHLVSDPLEIPFDVSPLHAIHIQSGSFGGLDQTREELRKQLVAIAEGTGDFANPISRYHQHKDLMRDGDPTKLALAQMQDDASKMRSQIAYLTDTIETLRFAPKPSLAEVLERERLGHSAYQQHAQLRDEGAFGRLFRHVSTAEEVERHLAQLRKKEKDDSKK